MKDTNLKKIKVTCRKISFLMRHQDILPDLKEIAMQLYPLGADPDKIDYDSPEYLMGANTALLALIQCLEEKGPQNKE
jgi:hypothetical protein